MIKYKVIYIIAGCLLIVAAFMKFAMVGYSFFALVLCAVAAALVLLALLPPWGKAVLSIAIVVFLALFSYWEIRIIKASRTDAPPGADYLIVLGCGVRGTTPSIAMRNRTDAAAAYLQANTDTVAVCSGGQGAGEALSEALAMKKLLMAAGIEESRILLEDKSTSTEENLKFSLELIAAELERTEDELEGTEDEPEGTGDETEGAGDEPEGTEDEPEGKEENPNAIGNKTIVVCSSEYHIFRAQYMSAYLFKDMADPPRTPFPGLPAHSTLRFSRIGYFMREAAGMIALKLLR